jgi:hypothetical protein
MLMDRTGFTASRESWVAFLISVAILVLFAFFFMYQIHSTRIERVVETDPGFLDADPQIRTSGKDIDSGIFFLRNQPSKGLDARGTTTIPKASPAYLFITES